MKTNKPLKALVITTYAKALMGLLFSELARVQRFCRQKQSLLLAAKAVSAVSVFSFSIWVGSFLPEAKKAAQDFNSNSLG